jgi:DNA-directed RNA polymerase specialized sigma24 family protein
LEYSAEDFNDLLRWLDPDEQRAAEKYEAIRRRLIQYFVLRHCSDPEALADETIDRVARQIANSHQGGSGADFYVVAKRLLLEPRPRPVWILGNPDLPRRNVEKDENREQLYDCLDKCMLTLTADKRELLMAYYEKSKRAKIDARRQLATQLGVSPAALRIRLFRITTSLRECIENCMKSQRQE